MPKENRNQSIQQIVDTVKDDLLKKEQSHVCFICTHNSRRSQFSQAWMSVLSQKLNLPITVYSAGTEKTACNQRTVDSLLRNGFKMISKTDDVNNPAFHLEYEGFEVRLSSKTVDDLNEVPDYIAIMTCGDADQNCPYIPSAKERVSLTYKDPKYADDTPMEAEAYDRCCNEIKTELTQILNELRK